MRCEVQHTKLSRASVDVSIPADASIANSTATLCRVKKARENTNDKTFESVLGLPAKPMEAGDTIATAAAANSMANIPLNVPEIQRIERCASKEI